MLNDLFNSTTDYIKTRLTNPFLGTLLAVWITRNFEFLYALFNFAVGVTLTQKEDYIRRYFIQHGTLEELWINLGISLAIIVSSFILLWITRLITNFYELRLVPLTYKYTQPKTLVTKERYEALFQLSKGKDDTIEKQRDSINRSEAIIRNLEQEMGGLQERITNLQLEIQEGNEKAKSLSLSVQSKDEQLDQLTVFTIADVDKLLLPENFEIFNGNIEKYVRDTDGLSISNIVEIRNVIDKLILDLKLKAFIEAYELIFITSEVNVNHVKHNIIKYFAELKLMSQGGGTISSNTVSGNTIKITDLGHHVYNIIMNTTHKSF